MFLRYQVFQVFVIFSVLALAVSDSLSKEKYKAMKEKYKAMNDKNNNVPEEIQRAQK